MSSIVRLAVAGFCLALSGCQLLQAVQPALLYVSLVYRFRTVTPSELSMIDNDLRNGTLRTASTGVGDLASCDGAATTGISLDLRSDSGGTL